MKLSIFFYPNQSKANKKNGKIPIYMRLMLNRQKAEMRLNAEVTEEEVKAWDSRTMRFTNRNARANSVLNNIENKFEDFRYHNATSLTSFSVKTIRDTIMGLQNKPSPLIRDYIDGYYKAAIAPNEVMSEGTKRNYRKTIKHVNSFLANRKMINFTLKEVNNSFAYDFRDYLLGTDTGADRVGMKEPSALDNIKKLRTIFDRALEEGLVATNPFKKIKLKSKSARRARLDVHQVRSIYKLDLSQFPIQQLYRDIFLFSVFTGLSYADGNSLRQSDLNLMTGGDIRLFLKRCKTEIVTEMILPQQAKEIIDRYKNTAEVDITKRVLPGRSNKEVNVQLKILANMANVPIKLSTHIARHSFRQLLSEADIFEIAVIKRMMGHSRSSDIDDVYYSVTESRLLEAKRKFELYLTKSLL